MKCMWEKWREEGGVPFTEETRKRLSEAMKARNALKRETTLGRIDDIDWSLDDIDFSLELEDFDFSFGLEELDKELEDIDWLIDDLNRSTFSMVGQDYSEQRQRRAGGKQNIVKRKKKTAIQPPHKRKISN